MIFVTMLVYPLNSAKRFAAERCLWALFRQLGEEDVLLTFEKPQSTDQNDAWRLKPRIFGLGLAVAQKDEWVYWVDADIEFRDNFVHRLKDFLSQVTSRQSPVASCPILCVTKVWERGKENWIPDERIHDYWQRAMLYEFVWDFYFGTGMMVANKAFLAYIDEWQMLTDKSQYYPDETSLVTLAHKYRDKWQLVWLPDDLHYVGWKVCGDDANAAAVHIGNTELSRWLKTALKGQGTRDKGQKTTEVTDDAD
jgi:hypothetical protein